MSAPRVLILLVAACALLVSACGGDDDDDGGTTTVIQPAATTPATEAPSATVDGDDDDDADPTATSGVPAEATLANARRAIATATGSAGGNAYDIDRDDDTGQVAWAVKLNNGSEVTVSLDGRNVISTAADGDDDVSEDGQLLDTADVSLADALRAAAKQSGDASFESADIDRDDDVANAPLLWTLSFDAATGGETEIDVDATTGEVTVRTGDDD